MRTAKNSFRKKHRRSNPGKRIPTIMDMARKTGFSTASVSRAMTGKDGVGSKSRERILAAARELDYHPNLFARGLVAKNPQVLGIIIPRTSEFVFSNPFYSEILKGIGEKARESGYYLLLSFAGANSYTLMLRHGLAAGILVVSNRIDDPRIEETWKMKFPMVLIPGFPQSHRIPSLDVDSFDGAFKAVDYLAGLGHKRIAFLNGPMNSKASIERLAGYHRALKKHGLGFDKGLIREFDASMKGGHEQMRKLLSLPRVPTAVLVINDYSALGALSAAQEMSFKVPENISIIGFGDVPFASMTEPPLTTIKAPYQQLGYEAAAMLLKVIQGGRLAEKHRVLPVELIIRKSAAPLSGHEVVVSRKVVTPVKTGVHYPRAVLSVKN